ncbi:hypothetical protein [Geomicrobium sp. JCM 19038]|uniref:hypothetical protein n=1 Tax=Geomicrobium sp. JCM 19038 TaxID=1460635 RepID=UPI0009DF5071|nr:hypothetical protein [Geomicrobium sp. JCM 19038]
MDVLLWITIGFILIGFFVLLSMKKGMENNLAFITANKEDDPHSIKTHSIIWWILSATVWGIVSMMLIVWSFHSYFG